MLYSEELEVEPFPLLLRSDTSPPTEVFTSLPCSTFPSWSGERQHGLSPVLPWGVLG